MLPVFKGYHEDELAYSWLLRLCHENGIQDVETYFRNFMSGDRKSAYSKVPYDIKVNFIRILETLDCPEEMDPFDTYLDTSLAALECSALSERKKGSFLNNALHPRPQHSKIRFYNYTAKIPEVSLCPECMKEDKEKYGHHYIHRAHNIPDVRVCHKHGTILSRYSGRRYHELGSAPVMEEDRLKAAYDMELAYSRFAKELLDARLPLCRDDICKMIIERTGGRDILNTIDPELRKVISRPKKSFNFSADMTLEMLVIILMTLYRTTDDIVLPERMLPEKAFLDRLEKEGYQYMESKDLNVMKLRHMKCGSLFYTTEDNYIRGWRCPHCDTFRSDQEIMEQLISDTTDGRFALAGRFKDTRDPVRIKRLSDGATEEFPINSFVLRYPNIRKYRLTPPSEGISISSNQTDKNYHKLIETFDGDELIIVSEICETLGNQQVGVDTVRSLIRHRKLYRVYHGFVSFSPEKQCTFAERFFLRHIRGRLHTYGYITGITFNKWLLNEDNCDRIDVCTTRYKKVNAGILPCGSEDQSFNIRLKFYPPKCPLNEKNILFLPVLDNLAAYKKPADQLYVRYREYLDRNHVTMDDIKEYLPFYPPKTDERLKRVFPEQ